LRTLLFSLETKEYTFYTVVSEETKKQKIFLPEKIKKYLLVFSRYPSFQHFPNRYIVTHPDLASALLNKQSPKKSQGGG